MARVRSSIDYPSYSTNWHYHTSLRILQNAPMGWETVPPIVAVSEGLRL
jgi:hypothetical protein